MSVKMSAVPQRQARKCMYVMNVMLWVPFALKNTDKKCLSRIAPVPGVPPLGLPRSSRYGRPT